MLTICARNNLGRAVPWLTLLPRSRQNRPTYIAPFDSLANEKSSKFESVFLCRDTYVCFLKFGANEPVATCVSGAFTSRAFGPDSFETDDPGTHAEKKGPVYYVNSAKVGEEKAQLRDGWQCDGSARVNSIISPDNLQAHGCLTGTDFLKNERADDNRKLADSLLEPKLDGVCS